jgi:hypothetical protein
MGSDDGSKSSSAPHEWLEWWWWWWRWRLQLQSRHCCSHWWWSCATTVCTIQQPHTMQEQLPSPPPQQSLVRKWRIIRRVALIGILVLLFVLFWNDKNNVILDRLSPEYILTDTFQRQTDMDYDYLPPHCQSIAKRFDACQQRKFESIATTMTSSVSNQYIPTVVFACHRRWCHSVFGHCQPCSGLGDRFRFLISQINDLSSSYTSLMIQTSNNNNENKQHRRVASRYDDTCHVHIDIDAPIRGLQTLASTVYRDPAGWFSELLHFRSYDVTQREMLPYTDIISSLIRSSSSSSSATSSSNYTNLAIAHQKKNTYFTHFTPENYAMNTNYNACYFHILYRPDQYLENDIRRHMAAIRKQPSSSIHQLPPIRTDSYTTPYNIQQNVSTASSSRIYTIGIHYRTGDSTAFGIANADQRVQKDQVIAGWSSLYRCSVDFAERLFPRDALLNHQIRFFLATDNPTVKDYIRRQYQNPPEQSPQNSSFVPVYVTDFEPDSYLRGNSGDRQALQELYLLAGCDGIVANTLPKVGYEGSAHHLSQFILLAKKIGFIPNSQFQECSLE